MNRRRASDKLSGHIQGVVNEERWRVIDRALEDIDMLGHVNTETWAKMSERDRALFEGKGPER